MAIEIKRPPLDFETNVALGLDLPMNSTNGSGFEVNFLSIDQAVANVKNLMLTNHGERPMHPKFGLNLRGILFDNATEQLEATIRDEVDDNFSFWLPYIFINELIVDRPDDYPNKLIIQITISLVGNEIDTRSVQIALNTDDGSATGATVNSNTY